MITILKKTLQTMTETVARHKKLLVCKYCVSYCQLSKCGKTEIQQNSLTRILRIYFFLVTCI